MFDQINMLFVLYSISVGLPLCAFQCYYNVQLLAVVDILRERLASVHIIKSILYSPGILTL